MPQEQFKIFGEEVVAKIKEIIKEGNARRIIVKSEKGEAMLEVPLTIGAIGALVAPVLAALLLVFVSGALVGLGLILAGRAKMKSEIPFGTFLTAATFLAMVWGSWALRLFFSFTG